MKKDLSQAEMNALMERLRTMTPQDLIVYYGESYHAAARAREMMQDESQHRRACVIAGNELLRRIFTAVWTERGTR